MATVIGDLAVRIGADTSGLTKGLGVARKRVNRFTSDVKGGGAQLAKYGAAATAAAGAVAVVTSRVIEANRQTANLAKLGNTSVATFGKMAFAAKSVGVEQEKLADILKDTSDRVGDFLATGGGPMADFFENIAPKIGVTAEEFRNLSGPQALQKYVNGLEQANLSQSEMTFYMETIASDATALLPLLRNNGEAMAAQAAQAERLGLALSDIDSAKIEEAAGVMDQAASVASGFLDQFGAQLAPVLSAAGRQFIGLAEDAGGVGEAAADSFNVVVDAVATVANALDRMDRVLLQSETAVDTFALAFRVGLLEVAREIVEIPTAAVNEMIMAINAIPGLGDIDLLGMSDFGKKIQGEINSAQSEILNLNETLREELNKPLSGDQFKRYVAQAEEAAQESAAALAAANADATGGEGEGGESFKTSEENKALMDRLDRIRQGNMTELELLREKLSEESAIINEAKEKELITDLEYKEQFLANLENFEAKRNDIEKEAKEARERLAEREQKAKLDGFANMFGDLSTLMNTESRKMFEIGKAAALAGAIVDGYAAITGAYKVGAKIGGPVLGATFGAAAAAATFSQIQAIRSASFNGGGGGSGGGGSVTQGINDQTEQVQRRSTSVDISLIGADNRDRAVASSVIQQINEEIERGERINRVGLA